MENTTTPCPACDGCGMLPGTQPDDDIMNTPCPDCNPDQRLLHRPAFDEIDAYHRKCSKEYGPNPTPFQSGVLLGLEIARGFAARCALGFGGGHAAAEGQHSKGGAL